MGVLGITCGVMVWAGVALLLLHLFWLRFDVPGASSAGSMEYGCFGRESSSAGAAAYRWCGPRSAVLVPTDSNGLARIRIQMAPKPAGEAILQIRSGQSLLKEQRLHPGEVYGFELPIPESGRDDAPRRALLEIRTAS